MNELPMWYSIFDTDFGPFGFVAHTDGLLATFLPPGRASLREMILRAWPEAKEHATGLPGFRRDVRAYFAGKRVEFEVEVELSDQPAFRRRVLQACARIPFGETVTYAELARAARRPGAARAVGNAMASNPLPLVMPCHRVLRADGSPGGFSAAGGVALKRRMLELERAAVTP